MNTKERELQTQIDNVRSRIALLQARLEAPKRKPWTLERLIPSAAIGFVLSFMAAVVHSEWSETQVETLQQHQQQCEAQIATEPAPPKHRADCDCSLP